MILFGLPFAFMDGVLNGAVYLTMMVAVIVGWPLVVVVHEAGHALTARLCWRVVVLVRVGGGRIWWTARLGQTQLEIRRNLFSGGQTIQCRTSARPNRLADAALVLGGPAANIVFAAIGFRLAASIGGVGDGRLSFTVASLFGMALAQLWTGVANLLPTRSYGRGHDSDGLLLWRLLTNWSRIATLSPLVLKAQAFWLADRFDEATNAALNAVATTPDDAAAVSMAIVSLSRLKGHSAAIDWYFSEARDLDFVEGGPRRPAAEVLASLQANVAWSALKAERCDLSDQIEALSQSAFNLAPGWPAIAGIRGAWLVESDRYEDGIPILVTAVRRTADPRDKADYCEFLARASRKQGDEARATAFEEVGRRFLAAA